MKMILRMFKKLFSLLWKFIDRRIIIPLTKLILLITNKFSKVSDKFEKLLTKSNTLLFLSLFITIIISVITYEQVFMYSNNSADLLTAQPVTAIYNEEAYVVEGLPETVDVTLIGSSSELYFAKQSPSHEIIVDLTGLKPGTHKVAITYNQALQSIDYNVNPGVATVIIYPKVSKTMTLTTDILNQDELDPKLSIEEMTLSEDKVVIKGAEHQLAEVATVKALVDVNNIAKQEVGNSTIKDVPLKAYDEHGNVIDVEVVPNKVDVEIEIASPSKEVPIKIVPEGTVSFGKAISSISASETKVTIYGNEEELSDINFINLYVDVNGLDENKTFKSELEKPSGVRHMSVSNVNVDIKLGDASEKDIENVNIETRNLNEIYTVQGISEEDTKVVVTAKGVSDIIDILTASDVVAYLDLEGYGVGVHEVEVQVEGDDSRATYIPKTKKVQIRIVTK